MTIEEIAEIFEGTTPLKGTMKKYTTAGEIEIEDGVPGAWCPHRPEGATAAHRCTVPGRTIGAVVVKSPG